MAVVVTTPAPALPAARVREARARLGPEPLAGVAAAGLTALLIGGGLARGVPDDGWLSWASRGLTATAWLVLLATAAAAWAYRRDAIGLLVAATLAPLALLAQATLDTLLDTAAAAQLSHFGWGLVCV